VKKSYSFIFVLMFVFAYNCFTQTSATLPNNRYQRKEKLRNIQITPEQEAKIFEYLRQNFPETVDRLEKLKITNPAMYKNQLVKIYKEITYVERIKNNDPERYQEILKEKKLNEKSLDLARKYKETDDEQEKLKIKKDLEELLYQLFNYRQKNREFEIKRLEKKLAELKAANIKRNENKKLIIEKRLKQLIGEKDYLNW